MSKSHGAIAHSVLNILVSIDIEHMRSGTTLYETRRQDRILIITFGIGMTAARYEGVGFTSEQLRIAKPGCEKVHDLVPLLITSFDDHTVDQAVLRRSRICRSQFLTGLGSRLRRLECKAFGIVHCESAKDWATTGRFCIRFSRSPA